MPGSRPLCILSVGRSGTSLAARVVNVLGVDLGPEEGMLAASHWNPAGFWEQHAIMELNDEILATLGGTYWDPPERPAGWERGADVLALRSRAADLVAEYFGSSARWGFKDPRTVFTLPFWRDVVGEMDYLICVRDPREVIRSLQTMEPAVPPHELAALWLHATCEAVRQTAGERRLILFYEDWFDDAEGVVERLAGFVDPGAGGLSPERAATIRELFDADLRTQRASEESFDGIPFEARVLMPLLRLLAAEDAREPGMRGELQALASSLDGALAARPRRAAGNAQPAPRLPAMLPTSSPERSPAARAGVPAAITVDGLAKTFRIPRQRYRTFKERALHPVRSREVDELHALEDVSLTVAAGEFFGVVGRNGSGKSTLLKCLAGIYVADRGTVTIDGKLSPFIELGVGFNPELTARDNVFINAILLGLSRREARERFDRIVAFAELEEFLELKLKNYSSGMQVRLAFAVATQVDADVLLVDEVLAVGDAAFQQKCFAQFQRLKEAGRTIVFVTHDMHAVEQFCDRAMLLERGRVVDVGDPHGIARAYNQLNFGRLVDDGIEGARLGAHTAAEIVAAWFEDGAGRRIASIEQRRDLEIVIEVRFHARLDEPVLGFALRNQVGHTIFASRTDVHGTSTGSFAPGDVAVMRVPLDNRLAPSEYRLSPWVARADIAVQADALDLREDLARLTVYGTHTSGGVVDLAHDIAIERA